MIQCSRGPGFLFKAKHAVSFERDEFRQDLDGNIAV